MNGTFARGHRLRMPGVATAVRACKPPMAGPDHPCWKGGRIIKRGYVLIWIPGHPNASRGYVPEHRLVVEKRLGRYLTADEHVHHVNHDRRDNHDENLQVPTRAEHLRVHPRRRPGGWLVRPGGCIDCGTKSRKHRGNGRCSACYEKHRRQSLTG